MCHCPKNRVRLSDSLPSDNLTLMLYGVNDLRLEQRPIPEPRDDEVLICIESMGICGSDILFIKEGQMGPYILKDPIAIGHEASGRIVKLGKNVKCLSVGDRVGIEPLVTCRACSFCKEGRRNLCPHGSKMGKLGRYYVHPAESCHKLPDNVSYDEGALIEPLSVSIYCCKRGGVTAGSKVLIMGAGTIGLLVMMCAKAFGASKVLITDISERRLRVAKQLGAEHTLLVNNDDSIEKIEKDINDILGCNPTISIDCCGAEQATKIALEVTQSGGVAVLLGLHDKPITLHLAATVYREVDIRGAYHFTNQYPTAMNFISSGKICVKSLITHHFRIEDALLAFDTAMNCRGEPVKVMVHANPSWKQ